MDLSTHQTFRCYQWKQIGVELRRRYTRLKSYITTLRVKVLNFYFSGLTNASLRAAEGPEAALDLHPILFVAVESPSLSLWQAHEILTGLLTGHKAVKIKKLLVREISRE